MISYYRADTLWAPSHPLLSDPQCECQAVVIGRVSLDLSFTRFVRMHQGPPGIALPLSAAKLRGISCRPPRNGYKTSLGYYVSSFRSLSLTVSPRHHDYSRPASLLSL